MMYDEEHIIRDVEEMIKANLNTEIAKVNTDKGATIGEDLFLADIPDDKYVFETLDSRINDFKGYWVQYGLVDTSVKAPSNDNFIDGVTVTVQIATFDNGEKQRSNTMYKLLRYRRALKQVVMNNPDVFRGYATMLTASLKPDAFPFSNKKVILTIGIDIIASITAN